MIAEGAPYGERTVLRGFSQYPQVGEPKLGHKTSPIAAPEEAPPAPSGTVTVCYFNGDIREGPSFVVRDANSPVAMM